MQQDLIIYRIELTSRLSSYQLDVLSFDLGPVEADQDLVEDGAQDAAKVRGHDRDVEPVVVGAKKRVVGEIKNKS